MGRAINMTVIIDRYDYFTVKKRNVLTSSANMNFDPELWALGTRRGLIGQLREILFNGHKESSQLY